MVIIIMVAIIIVIHTIVDTAIMDIITVITTIMGHPCRRTAMA